MAFEAIEIKQKRENLIDGLDFFTSDFMENREQPENQQSESFDWVK